MSQTEPRTGRLQDTPLADLLQDLYSCKASGILALLHQEEKKSIFLNNGKIVYAMSNLIEDRLGGILVGGGKLTKDQVNKVLVAGKETKK